MTAAIAAAAATVKRTHDNPKLRLLCSISVQVSRQ